MASMQIARSLNGEKRSEEMRGNQPESGRSEEDGPAVDAEVPPQPPESLPPQQSLAAKLSPLPSLRKYSEDGQKEVVVAEIGAERSIGRRGKYEVIVVVGVGKGMATK